MVDSIVKTNEAKLSILFISFSVTDSTKVDSGYILFYIFGEGNYSLQTVLHKGERDLETAIYIASYLSRAKKKNLHSYELRSIEKTILHDICSKEH